MNLNWSKGFLRIWLVLSLAWVAGSYFLAGHETQERIGLILNWSAVQELRAERVELLEAARNEQSGEAMVEVIAEMEEADARSGFTPFQIQEGRRPLGEHIREVAYDMSVLTLAPPAALFVMGLLLGWVFLGFKR